MDDWEHGTTCRVSSWCLTLLFVPVFVLRAVRCQLGVGLHDFVFPLKCLLAFQFVQYLNLFSSLYCIYLVVLWIWLFLCPEGPTFPFHFNI